MMWGWEGGPHPGWWPWMGFGWVFIVMMVVMCVVMMVMMMRHRHRVGMGGHGQHGDRALDILRGRYAKGELSKQDFEEMRKTLG